MKVRSMLSFNAKAREKVPTPSGPSAPKRHFAGSNQLQCPALWVPGS